MLLDDRSAPLIGKRNGLVRKALDAGAEWVLFVDDYMLPGPDALERLLARGIDLVGGLYFRRHPPFAVDAARFDPDKTERCLGLEEIDGSSVRPVDFTGTGFLLIRRRVLEAVGAAARDPSSGLRWAPSDYPWFECSYELAWNEDVEFCTRARDLGFQPYVDTSFVVPHLARIGLTFKTAIALSLRDRLSVERVQVGEQARLRVSPRVPVPDAIGS